MEATDHERSCEAPIPITVLSTHGSGTQAVAFQPLVGAAGNEAVGPEAVGTPQTVGAKASSFHPCLLQVSELSPLLFQVRCGRFDAVTHCCAHHRTICCGFGGSNNHSPFLKVARPGTSSWAVVVAVVVFMSNLSQES